MADNTPTDTPPAPPAGTPPPASETVLNGARREGGDELAAELERERMARRNVEMRNAELEDENQRLKSIPAPEPAPEPTKRQKKKVRFTFFEPDESED